MNIKLTAALIVCTLFSTSFPHPLLAEDLPLEKALLTEAPHVPPAITRTTPARVVVEISVKELQGELAPGVRYLFWTFGGHVPGPFIRVREGDTVEVHLSNDPANKLPHNIDLHAATGPGGGAASTFTAPGHTSRFSFRALNPGLYVYHCATAPVGMHVANGMYGLIFVQPKEGLPHMDKEYYVLQSEFYTDGIYGEKGFQPFSMQHAIDEKPSYVVFNGKVGALTADNALPAKVGENIRLFLGNAGPNLVSSFHVIGEIFDTVYTEGGTVSNQHNVQSTLIPSGGAAMVEFKADVPGSYVLVDHSLFRAFNKGALGLIKVEGLENKEIYSGKELDEVYLGEAAVPVAKEEQLRKQYQAAVAEDPKLQKLSKDILVSEGQRIFASNCFMCHQLNGEGLPGVFPPLAKSDFLMKLAKGENRERLIGIVLNGKQGQVTVNGKDYNNVMPPLGSLSDREITAVLTYVTNSWGNSAKPFTVDEIRAARAVVTQQSGNVASN